MEDKRYQLHDSGSNGGHARRKRAEAAMSHCHAGHPLNDDNLAIDAKGNRRCLACAKERIAARKEQAFEERFGAYLD